MRARAGAYRVGARWGVVAIHPETPARSNPNPRRRWRVGVERPLSMPVYCPPPVTFRRQPHSTLTVYEHTSHALSEPPSSAEVRGPLSQPLQQCGRREV
jgi:hypothetical protein